MRNGTEQVQPAVELESQAIDQALSGDPEAFVSLYDAHIDRIYRFIYFRVNDEQLAGDLASQVFISAWENIGRYQKRGLPFSAWLFQIARHQVADHFRNRHETYSLDDGVPGFTELPDPSADVVAYAEQKFEAERIRAALMQITNDQREVLVLKFVEDLSTREIARILGKRAGAVRALQMRGLRLLASILGVEDE